MNDQHKVRVRFAPSPTGMLHIGGLRTALFNYLFAKHHSGEFILRLEDTDRERFVEAGVEQIQKSLQWLGIVPDEGYWLGEHKGKVGPYIQSERLPTYRKYAEQLVAEGKAYYSRISADEYASHKNEAIAKRQAFVYKQDFEPVDDGKTDRYPIRAKVTGRISWRDEIRGTFETKAEQIDDFIIVKADGFPTYNFANIVDDHLMHISHVIRGDEFISSTAKHAILYDYLGWIRPNFVHLPTILGPDGKKKLSKRDGDVDVLSYKEAGYLPEALINFLALLGWNEGSTKEIFSLDELIDAFDIARVQKSPAVFDRGRLDWMNGEYIRGLSIDQLCDKLVEFVPADWIEQKEYFKKVVALDQERLKTLAEAKEVFSFFFEEPKLSKAELAKQYDSEILSRDVLNELVDELASDNKFAEQTLEPLLRSFCESRDIPTGKLFRFVRYGVTGRMAAPGLFETLAVLGQARSIARLKQALKLI